MIITKINILFLTATLLLSATIGFGQLYAPTPGTVLSSSNSNVGINEPNPTNELHVNGSIRGKGLLIINTGSSAAATLRREDGAAMSMGGGAAQGVMIFDENYKFQIRKATRTQVENQILNAGTAALTVDGPTGNIGINTENPGAFQLAVEGTIGARKVKVTLDSPFPDYVFEQDYSLMPLSELKAFINKHKHLPEVPSAVKVEEEGGIELGEINIMLLKKVEELTLYILDQQEQIKVLKNKNEILEQNFANKLENLETELQRIKKKIEK